MTMTGLIALYLAGRNIVVDRWDRRGVKRLAIFLCSTMIASNLLRAYHVTSLWERSVILLCLAAAFVTCFELIVITFRLNRSFDDGGLGCWFLGRDCWKAELLTRWSVRTFC